MSSARRREQIERLRAEGRAAFHAGKTKHSGRYTSVDRMQWLSGYEDAEREHRANPRNEQPDYEAWYQDALGAANDAGFVGMSAGDTIRELARQVEQLSAALAVATAPPARPKLPYVSISFQHNPVGELWLLNPAGLPLADTGPISWPMAWRRPWTDALWLSKNHNAY